MSDLEARVESSAAANKKEFIQWLEYWRLEVYEAPLASLGVCRPVDVLDMTPSMVASLRLKPLEQKRWFDAVADLKDFAAKGNGSSTASSPAAKGQGSSEEYKEPFIFEVFDGVSALVAPLEAVDEMSDDLLNGAFSIVADLLGIESTEEAEAAAKAQRKKKKAVVAGASSTAGEAAAVAAHWDYKSPGKEMKAEGDEGAVDFESVNRGIGFDALRSTPTYQQSTQQAAGRRQQQPAAQGAVVPAASVKAAPRGSVGAAQAAAFAAAVASGAPVKVVRVRRHAAVAEGWVTQAEFDGAMAKFGDAAARSDGDLPATKACALLAGLLDQYMEPPKQTVPSAKDQAAAIARCCNSVDNGVSGIDSGAFGHCLWLCLRGDAGGLAGGGLFDSSSATKRRRDAFANNLKAAQTAAAQPLPP